VACHLKIDADPVPDQTYHFDADPDLDADQDPHLWLNTSETQLLL
jgi:hypothetical protein